MMKSLLKSKNWWKIVNNEEKESEPLTKSNSYNSDILAFSSKKISATSAEKDEDNLKFIKLLADWHKKNTKAINLFVCNINPDFLDEIYIDDITKAIWNYL